MLFSDREQGYDDDHYRTIDRCNIYHNNCERYGYSHDDSIGAS